MRIAKILRLFKQEQRILTLDEARAEAKAAYLNNDLDDAEKWNEAIASILSSGGHRRAPQPVK